MTADPICVTEDDSLQTVVELMERGRVKRLPVIRDGRLVGIVSRANLVHAALGLARDAKRRPAMTRRSAARFWKPSASSPGHVR
jgi:predicted transcriptional regulator